MLALDCMLARIVQRNQYTYNIEIGRRDMLFIVASCAECVVAKGNSECVASEKKAHSYESAH